MAAASTVDGYIKGAPKEQQAIMKELRGVIVKAGPELEEAIKWRQPCYSYGGTVCYFSYHKAHVRFGFFKGTSLSDPKSLLEGTGKGNRHVKLGSVKDIKKSQFSKWVKEAISLHEE